MRYPWRCCRPSPEPMPRLAEENETLRIFLEQEARLEELRACEKTAQLKLCYAPTLGERLPLYSMLLTIKAELARLEAM